MDTLHLAQELRGWQRQHDHNKNISLMDVLARIVKGKNNAKPNATTDSRSRTSNDTVVWR